jgi:hypothetical protein
VPAAQNMLHEDVLIEMSVAMREHG